MLSYLGCVYVNCTMCTLGGVIVDIEVTLLDSYSSVVVFVHLEAVSSSE